MPNIPPPLPPDVLTPFLLSELAWEHIPIDRTQLSAAQIEQMEAVLAAKEDRDLLEEFIDTAHKISEGKDARAAASAKRVMAKLEAAYDRSYVSKPALHFASGHV